MTVLLDLWVVETLAEYWLFVWNKPFTTPCEVIDRNKARGGRGGPTYNVSFRYNVDGVDYTCTSNVSRDFYDKHPKGSEAQCYVSSVSSQHAIIGKPDFTGLAQMTWQLPLCAVPFNCVAVLLAVSWTSPLRKERRRHFEEKLVTKHRTHE